MGDIQRLRMSLARHGRNRQRPTSRRRGSSSKRGNRDKETSRCRKFRASAHLRRIRCSCFSRSRSGDLRYARKLSYTSTSSQTHIEEAYSIIFTAFPILSVYRGTYQSSSPPEIDQHAQPSEPFSLHIPSIVQRRAYHICIRPAHQPAFRKDVKHKRGLVEPAPDHT